MRRVPVEEWMTRHVEGAIDLFFGGLGSGKTYAATAEILNDLRSGGLVYATWDVTFPGVDERSYWYDIFFAIIGFKRTFYAYSKENFHYVPLTDPDFMDKFAKSTDCTWYIDEAYVVIDSYVKNKMSVEQRLSIYGTRHFNRRLVLVAQRPTSIHIAARAMVNRFYKCERPFPFLQRLLHFTFFVRTEYQDMMDENVDLEKPLSTKWYFGKKEIFQAYNSKYLRGDIMGPDAAKIAVYKTNPVAVLLYLFRKKPPQNAAGRALARPATPLSPP